MQSKPLIRWAGSKRKLLATLVESLPKDYERYVEPFCGSACLFFESKTKPALLTDINSELINALKEIKSNKKIRDQLLEVPNTEEEYYRIRSLDPETQTANERAIRFLYLNRNCFNGVYRTNMAGKFNVPRGNKTGAFPPQEVFDESRKKLRRATLKVATYHETLKVLEAGDFAYIDPPYSKTAKFTGQYGLGSFNGTHLNDLFDDLKVLDAKGVKFLFSYRACEETITSLEKQFKVERLSVKRHISGFKNSWDEAEEILVKNYV